MRDIILERHKRMQRDRRIPHVLAVALLVCAAPRSSLAQTAPDPSPPAGLEISWKHPDTVSEKIPFVVYREPDRERHFAPSGQIGDATDLTVLDAFAQKPKSGHYCIRIDYSAQASRQQNWAGVYWQEPDFNFGETPDAGYNLRAAAKLTFWARGEKGTERITVKAGGIQGSYPDTFSIAPTEIRLSKSWKKYSLPLAGQDLTYVIGGFYVGFTRLDNPAGATIYLDEILYE